MKLARMLMVMFLAISFSTSALAQDKNQVKNTEFGVTIKTPAKWEIQSSDKAVANFKHRGSQSQIEVIGTKLMTPDVAEVFFKTFHKTLKESNFEQKEQKDLTIGSHKGKQTSYKFTHSGVKLEVTIFQYIKGNNAWLVVGYMQDTDKDKYYSDFKTVVESMQFAAK